MQTSPKPTQTDRTDGTDRTDRTDRIDMTHRTDMRDRTDRADRTDRPQAGQTVQDRLSAHRLQTDLVIAIMAEVPGKILSITRADMFQRLTTKTTLRSQLWPNSRREFNAETC